LSKQQLILIIEKLIKQVEQLGKELEKHKHPKNSGNSSVPPSKDENRPKRNQSLRQKSGRKVGGQKGHRGTTLQMTETPDEIIRLVPQYCNKCGADLEGREVILDSKRQLIEIPPITPKYVEYQCFHKQCKCGHKQSGDYPAHVTNHIQYGPSVEAAIGYCSAYQYLPFNRMKQMFGQVFNLPISQGTLGNIVGKLAQKAQPVYEGIRSYIENSSSVGGDETGIRTNGNKWWGWIWQNLDASFIAITPNRASQTIKDLFPNGFPNAILNSDR
jgi:transposase